MSSDEESNREKDIQIICESLVSERTKPQLTDVGSRLIKIPSDQNPNEKIAMFLQKTLEPLPDNPIVLFAHGDGETIDTYTINGYTNYSTFFTSNGMNFCIIDYRGTGYSDGQLNTSGISETADLITVINYLTKSGYTKISLFGRSLGGYCGIILASLFPNLVCVALDSPCVSIRDLCIYQVEKFRGIRAERVAQLYEEACALAKKRHGVDYIGAEEPIDVADRIRQPIFVIHGERDTLVPLSNSVRLMERVGSDEKKFVPFSAGHNDVQRVKYFLEQFVFILRQNGSDVTELI